MEIFLQREGMDRYYQYMLNYAGYKSERRVLMKKAGGVARDFAWNYPWIVG